VKDVAAFSWRDHPGTGDFGGHHAEPSIKTGRKKKFWSIEGLRINPGGLGVGSGSSSELTVTKQ